MPAVDLIIFGGGIAGLWTLSEATRLGYRSILLEAYELGSGQTIASQGIIHGGLKYTLQGMMTGSARGIREMPLIWRKSLAGEQTPDLTRTEIRSPHCYLWRTDSLSSRLGMFGAKMGLRVAPRNLTDDETPSVLKGCPGSIGVMEEQVISPCSLISNLAQAHSDCIFKYDPDQLTFDTDASGNINAVELQTSSDTKLNINTQAILLTAGNGNEALHAQACPGTKSPAAPFMQRRPLHMVLVRGDLPPFNGHCVDGAKTRVTITSDTDSQGRTIWQLGGQIAEQGVGQPRHELISHAARELTAVMPGINLKGLEWNTYQVDRAEGATKTGLRPELPQLVTEGNLITAWPTKLALAPRLAEDVLAGLSKQGITPSSADDNWQAALLQLPRPEVAQPPWETATDWVTLDDAESRTNAA
ncbi:FAD-dependent oxidoreductase [Gimesia panareensis]|uniref:Glycerol-3-phosphate dehydrogenase n=1 Tax=Gimesia panareensis TaxID=2527978 RepID=A0A517PZC2_9PLAN|nr:FAD-dependent oxidoreductase [Gimesia panareensis]QDT24722.1 glycerol-3-phosphate dehydrogenase [Gimesia panareensis]QDU47703.1 glycerol-3-phosphate dehydrogenase [Gimesia panareensis]